MTALALRNPGARPTGQKLWARSKPPEIAEDFARPLSKAQASVHLDHLVNYADRLPRGRGEAYGEITDKHVRVFRSILAWRSGSGRMTPSYREIAMKARCSIATVYRAIRILVSHGFLDYRRRWRMASGRNPRGQAVEQDTNCYRASIPQAAVDLLRNFRFGLDLKRVPGRLALRVRKLPELVEKPLPPDLSALMAMLVLQEASEGVPIPRVC